MPSKIELAGQQFGRLTVVEEIGRKRGAVTWRCVCDCGGEKKVSSKYLRSGATTSCGCYYDETRGSTKHGLHKHPTYITWCHMKQRCSNPNIYKWHLYGGRGVGVYEPWQESFEHFVADVGLRPKGKTLDRYPNNDGNYEPGNVRWATVSEQNYNLRTRGSA